MVNYYVILGLAITFEIAVRLIPTKVNFSAIDKFKEVALQLHQIVDIVIPNHAKNGKHD